MNAERPSDRASSRSGHYDFERLERSVEILIEDHERLSAEREALRNELVERERRILSLEAKLAAESQRRASAAEHVDRILKHLEAVERRVVDARAATVPSANPGAR